MKKSRFEILRSVGNQFYFRLVGKNGKTISTSETYTTKANAKKGIFAHYPDGVCPFEIEDLT